MSYHNRNSNSRGLSNENENNDEHWNVNHGENNNDDYNNNNQINFVNNDIISLQITMLSMNNKDLDYQPLKLFV